MAKQKGNDVAGTAVAGEPFTPAPGASIDSDVAATGQPDRLAELERANAELRQQIAALQAQQASPSSVSFIVRGNIPSECQHYKIVVRDAPTHVVKAPGAAAAWEKYCLELGVRATEAKPEIHSSNHSEWLDHQARRFGMDVPSQQTAHKKLLDPNTPESEKAGHQAVLDALHTQIETAHDQFVEVEQRRHADLQAIEQARADAKLDMVS